MKEQKELKMRLLMESRHLQAGIQSYAEELSRTRKLCHTYHTVQHLTGQPEWPASRLQYLEGMLNTCIDAFVNHRTLLEHLLQGIRQPELRLLLKLHYIDGYTWQKVAQELHYCDQHIYRLRDKAVCQLPDIPPDWADRLLYTAHLETVHLPNAVHSTRQHF